MHRIAANRIELDIEAEVSLPHDWDGLVHSSRSSARLPLSRYHSLDEVLFFKDCRGCLVGVQRCKGRAHTESGRTRNSCGKWHISFNKHFSSSQCSSLQMFDSGSIASSKIFDVIVYKLNVLLWIDGYHGRRVYLLKYVAQTNFRGTGSLHGNQAIFLDCCR